MMLLKSKDLHYMELKKIAQRCIFLMFQRKFIDTIFTKQLLRFKDLKTLSLINHKENSISKEWHGFNMKMRKKRLKPYKNSNKQKSSKKNCHLYVLVKEFAKQKQLSIIQLHASSKI